MWLDGALVYNANSRSARLFNRKLSPGKHTISAQARHQGSGGGVFSYMDAYRFNVKVGRVFAVRSQGTTTVTVRAFERGGVTATQEERLALSVAVK